MYRYEESDGQFSILNNTEKRMSVPRKETAIKLTDELNLAFASGAMSVQMELIQLSRRLKEGYLLVDVESDIYRQLKVIVPQASVFLFIRDPESNRIIYYDCNGSVLLERPL